METLQRFAAHTRHRPGSVTLSELGRKWLTLHVAPTPETYVHVANDYGLLEARTHNPPLSSYGDPARGIDVDTFVWVTKNGYPNAVPLTVEEEMQWPALAQFRDTFWPQPVGEEAWKPYERRDHWKERAYFLATLSDVTRNRPQYHALVDAIYRADLPADHDAAAIKDAVSDLYTGFVRYASPDQNNPRPSVTEMGTLLAALDLSHLETSAPELGLEPEVLTEPVVSSDMAPTSEIIEAKPAIVLCEASVVELNETALREHADVEAFRKRELLPPTFPVTKVLKQMWCAYLGVPVPSELLSAAQRRMHRQPERLAQLPEVAFSLLAAAPHALVTEHLDLSMPSLVKYYYSSGRQDGTAGQPLTAQALVQGVLGSAQAPAELAQPLAKIVVSI